MIPAIRRHRTTPLIAAFVFCALIISGCKRNQQELVSDAVACTSSTMPIAQVQGSSDASPMRGKRVTVSGIVTHTAGNGLYLEEPDSDADAATSNALFVQDDFLPANVSPGDQIMLSGDVEELGNDRDTVTALIDIAGIHKCSERQPIPVTRFALPADERARESLEAMNLKLDQALVVTDPFGAERGELLLSLGGILIAPTESARPGADARARLDANRQRSLAVKLHADDWGVLPAGSQVLSIEGVFGHDGDELRLLAQDSAHTAHAPNAVIPDREPGTLRVLSFNLQNYFNGDGKGSGFPTPRGAESPHEFHNQRQRIRAAIEAIQPDLVVVMELENDGFDEQSAAADFSRDLNATTGARWLPVPPDTETIGSDAITTGIFFRGDRVVPIAIPQLFNGSNFDVRSRVPVAQAFRDEATGTPFVIVVNHLKSKGSCPESGRNANLTDGQGCWNQVRTEDARAMTQWAMQIAAQQAQGRVLIMGDLNAYRMEDPITTMLDAGLIDLTAPSGPVPNYSYRYRGSFGTLDYALASPAMLPLVYSARILNINSPWPESDDLPQPWMRSSDHDPVVVDLRFRSSSTRN